MLVSCRGTVGIAGKINVAGGGGSGGYIVACTPGWGGGAAGNVLVQGMNISVTGELVEREEGVSEPEDHAGMVCQIMALVLADPEYDFPRQQEFFQRHIEPWLGRLFKDLQEAPSASFYRAVGVLGEEFLRLEQHYYSMLG